MKDSGSDAIQGFCHVGNPHTHTHTQIHSLHFQMTFSLTILSIPFHNFQPFEVSDSPEGRFSSWLRRGIYVLLTLARRAFKVTHISEATRIPFSNVTERLLSPREGSRYPALSCLLSCFFGGVVIPLRNTLLLICQERPLSPLRGNQVVFPEWVSSADLSLSMMTTFTD